MRARKEMEEFDGGGAQRMKTLPHSQRVLHRSCIEDGSVTWDGGMLNETGTP